MSALPKTWSYLQIASNLYKINHLALHCGKIGVLVKIFQNQSFYKCSIIGWNWCISDYCISFNWVKWCNRQLKPPRADVMDLSWDNHFTLYFYNKKPSKNKHFLILLSSLARNSCESKLKRIFEILWVLFEKMSVFYLLT